MTRHEIAQRIGSGVHLATKRGRVFRATTSDYGVECEISTGNLRRIAWNHKRLGFAELFQRWLKAGKPDSTVWVTDQDGVGARNSSYVLATFKFLGE